MRKPTEIIKKELFAITVVFVLLAILVSLLVAVIIFISRPGKAQVKHPVNDIKVSIENEFSDKLENTKILKITEFSGNKGMIVYLDNEDYYKLTTDIKTINDKLVVWLCDYLNKYSNDLSDDFEVLITYRNLSVSWRLWSLSCFDPILQITSGCSKETLLACSSAKKISFEKSDGAIINECSESFSFLEYLSLGVYAGDDFSYISKLHSLKRLCLYIKTGSDLSSLRTSDGNVSIMIVQNSDSSVKTDYYSLDRSLYNNPVNIVNKEISDEEILMLAEGFSRLYINGEKYNLKEEL